jgi:hypothetical protein
MADSKPRIQLSDEELTGLLELMDDADTMELKLTVPQADHASTAAALRVDPLEAQIRQIFFFDTPELALNQAGVVVRARRVQGRGDDSTVKLRPVVPSELPSSLRASPNLVVEVDAMPGGYVCSASLKGVPKVSVREHLAEGGRLSKLFSKEQRAFYAEHAPAGLDLDGLAVLGPIFVLKAKSIPDEIAQKLVAELWMYPDSSMILELSTKSVPGKALPIAIKVREHLRKHGVELMGDQQTKTKTALEFFVRQLRE